MILSSLPLSEFVGLELPFLNGIFQTKVSAEENTSGIYKSGDGWAIYEDGEMIISKNLSTSSSYFIASDASSPAGYSWAVSITRAWGNYDGHKDDCDLTYVKSIVIEDGVTSIPDLAFAYMTDLETVTIPQSVTSFGAGAFCGCEKLKNINCEQGILSLSSKTVLGITSEGKYTETSIPMFSGCDSIENIYIGTANINIGEYCFYGCDSLKNVISSNNTNITEVGESAFSNCIALENVSLIGTFNEIPSRCFYNCESLKSVNSNKLLNITSVGEEAFYNCKSLTNIEFGSGSVNIGSYAFYNCRNLISVNIPATASIGSYSFTDCVELESTIIGEGVTNLGYYTFKGCVRLNRIAVPLSVTEIKQDTFNGCVSIELVVYPGSEDYWNEICVKTSGNEYFIAANKKYSHWHNDSTSLKLISYKEADCVTEGYTGDSICDECKWAFSTGSITPALGHNWKESVIPATSTSDGYKYRLCLRCAKTEMIETYDATTISFGTSTLSVNIGDTKALDITVTPDKYLDSMSYSSSDESIATVDASGNVTGVAVGTATITATAVSGVSATCNVKVTKKTYAVGDIIEYGNYPQTKVTDTELIEKLNAQELNWKSYGYISSNEKASYMRYCDVVLDGSKYRGVYFSTYRPSSILDSTSTTTKNSYGNTITFQYSNGYYINTMYWFKYEPLRWRVLDIFGLVISENIIDSQSFTNYVLINNYDYYGDKDKSFYSNDYKNSSIRKWLNEDFYNTSFTKEQKSNINSDSLSDEGLSEKIFLPSRSILKNESYFASTSSRKSTGTDYSKCQGLSTNIYLTRDPYNSYAGSGAWGSYLYGCDNYGEVSYKHSSTYRQYCSEYTDLGVRPVMNLSKLMEDTSIDLDSEETCTHSIVEDAAVAATCTESGLTAGSHCSICGEVITAQTVVQPTGHKYISDTLLPKCTEAGYTTHTCSACGDSYKDSYVSALGHNYVDEVVTSTCTGGGYTKHICSRCGDSYTDGNIGATGHTYTVTTVLATCGTNGYDLHTCSACGYSYRDNETTATGEHSYGKYIYNNDATTSSDGTETAKCDNCGAENTRTAEGTKLHTHTYIATVIEPTCKTQGYTEYTCSCGDSYRDNSKDIVSCKYIETVVTADCENDGYVLHTCKWCGDSYKTDEVKASGHTWKALTITASCTQEGGEIYSCEKCGHSKIENVVPALGHEYTVKVVEPTCEADGYTIHICSRCGNNYKDNFIPAIGHNDEAVTIQTTCIQDGYVLDICKNCGRTTKGDTSPATGHNFTTWTVSQEATELDEGLEQRHCTKCGYTEDRIISIVERTTYTVTFVADGNPVASVEYVKGSTTVDEPAVPHKDRYAGEWEPYTLDNKDITVNAKYSLIDLDTVKGIDTSKTASYNESTGVATININASSEGKTVVSTSSKKIPLDIVLVVDQSGSMADRLGGKTSKKQALINAANDFVSSVYDDAAANDIDHRVAIVGFAMGCSSYGGYSGYYNTELLTTGGSPIQMNDLTEDDYANALMYVNNDGKLNSGITDAIKNIDANGATAANYGLAMAKNIFSNTDGEDRQRIVVFMTDGAPTTMSEFDSKVASAAILEANQLKNTYGATVYSVGVMSSSDKSDRVTAFMNYVSSNYEDSMSIDGNYTKNADNYYINVESTNKLSSVFTEIVTENITRTTDFDNITVIDTLSKYFTLTSQQEKNLRVDIIQNYGVNNSDISISKNNDGTTTIMIKNLSPKDNGTRFEVNISFDVTANENAIVAGSYPTNTEDAGIIIGDNENYECVLKSPAIVIPEDRNISIFKINDEIFEISSSATAPETSFAGEYEFTGWNLNKGTKISDSATEYNATYVSKQNYIIVWNTASGTQKVTYVPGQVITEPDAGLDASGNAFRRWNGTVPITMPEKSIEFTAVYGDHEHDYDATITKEVTCLENGEMTYICSICGDTYTDTIVCPGKHMWKAISGVAESETGYGEFVCETCGEHCSRTLEYKTVSKDGSEGSYNSITNEFNYLDEKGNAEQPDGNVNIVVPVNDYFSNAESVEVYRKNTDGSKTKCNSEYEDGIISFETNHFSTYEFVASYNDTQEEHTHSYKPTVTPPTCTEQGYTTYTCSCGFSYKDDYQPVLGHNFENYTYNNDATTSKDGTETGTCSRCSAKDTRTKAGTKKSNPVNPNANAKINVAGGRSVDYRSKVTIRATATGVDSSYRLAIYVGNNRVATGSNTEVTYNAGETKGDINYTVKVVDANGNIAKDANGNEISKDGGKISCNSGFFKKLVAFFKGLFGSLPNVTVQPEK